MITDPNSRGQSHFESRSGRLNHIRKVSPEERLESCGDENLGNERCYGKLDFLGVSKVNRFKAKQDYSWLSLKGAVLVSGTV